MTSENTKYAILDATDWFSDRWLCSFDSKQAEKKQHSYYVEAIFSSLDVAMRFCEKRRKRDIEIELKELESKSSKESNIYIYGEVENPHGKCTCSQKRINRLTDIDLDGECIDFTPESLRSKRAAINYIVENYAMCPHCFYSISFGFLDSSTIFIPRNIAILLAVAHRKPEWFSERSRIYLISHYGQFFNTVPLAIVKVPSDQNEAKKWTQFYKVMLDKKDIIKFYTCPKSKQNN